MANANPEIATVSDSDEDSDDEEFQRVLELSKYDVGGAGTSSQSKKEDEELKRVIEMSLQPDQPIIKLTGAVVSSQEQPIIKLTGTMANSKNYVSDIQDDDDDYDSEAELEEALRRSLLDMGNVEKTDSGKLDEKSTEKNKKLTKNRGKHSKCDAKGIEDDLATLEESGLIESDQDNDSYIDEDSITKDLQEIEAIGMIDDVSSDEDAVKKDLAGIEQIGVCDNEDEPKFEKLESDKSLNCKDKEKNVDRKSNHTGDEKSIDNYGITGSKTNKDNDNANLDGFLIKFDTKHKNADKNAERSSDINSSSDSEESDSDSDNNDNHVKNRLFENDKNETLPRSPISVSGSLPGEVDGKENITSVEIQENDKISDTSIVDINDDNVDINTVDLTHHTTPKKVDVIEISDEENESIGPSTSSTPLHNTYKNTAENTSVIIETDANPSHSKARPDLAAIGARLGFSVSITQVKSEEEEIATSLSNPISTVVLSDSDDDVVMLDAPSTSYIPIISTPGVPYYQPFPFQPALSNEEVTKKMKNIFESGLAIHFSGEEMEACKAIATPIFPHQRVALAWMFRHENKENDGMRGGILADDMGLGKTLTVISLIMTNHWDGKPLAKPDPGYTRRAFNYGKKVTRYSKGKQNDGKKNKGGKKKASIGGLFDKFADSTDTDSDSDSESNKSRFRGKRKKNNEMKDFIVDDSSQSNSSSEESDESQSEDEFDIMSKDTSLQEKLNSSAKGLFNSSASDLFKKMESPLKENKVDIKENEESPQSENKEDEDDDVMTENEFVLSMIPKPLDDVELNPKLNVDGALDESSDDDIKPVNHFQRNDLSMQASISAECTTLNNKRKLEIEEKNKRYPNKKKIRNTKSNPYDDGDSDISLPDIESECSDLAEKGEPSKNKNKQDMVEPENSVINEETGLKLIIPPKEPAERRDRRRATLLVCPTSLVSHWVDQIHQHLHKGVNVKLKVHHGAGKALTGAELESHDIVITTYGTLAAEYGDLSPLSRAKWLRVVLDEGHNIKNHHTKSAKAALDLDTIRRWIVTGTPIQNNLMELWSLVNWLDFGMYAGKSQMHKFKDQIEGPCKKGNPRGFERLQVLVDAICLRRTKTDKRPDGSPLVVLPTKKILTREVILSEEERLCYGIYLKRAKEIVNRFKRDGDLLRNYAHVFALMTRLRQLCCHRELIQEVDWSEALKDKDMLTKQLEGFLDRDQITNNEDKNTMMTSTGLGADLEKRLILQLRSMIRSGVSDDCSVCLDDLKSPVITPCAHVFCRPCIEAVLETMKTPSCPLCRIELNKRQLLDAGQDDKCDDSTLADMKDIDVNISSSKVNAVLKEILRIQRDLPNDKIVVVSQFTSFLSILQPIMKKRNFRFVRLDGSMSFQDRSEAVRRFQSTKDKTPKIMLLSLKAGGVGLNLTSANHLLLLDPAWNPASEWQCFDRTHRLGQKKDVYIYKYIVKDSIEEKMLEIQAKKKDLISGAFHMPEDDRRRQRVQDIMSIFGI